VSVRVLCVVMLLVAAAQVGRAQELRFSNHREAKVPEYALLHLGPFYSNITFSQSAGYRYTESTGTGSEFLFRNRRGVIVEDGSELPLVTSLSFRNYVFITEKIDLDASVNVSYSHYPLDTQEDDFFVDIAEEGAIGDLSATIEFSKFLKMTLFDKAVYRTDYVDERGISDYYGGSRYEYFENTVGADLDWLLGPTRNLGVSVSRNDLLPRDDEFDYREHTEYREEVVYEKLVNPDLVTGIRGRFGQISYPSTNRSDSSSQEATVFATARVTEQSVLSASLGYSMWSIDKAGLDGREDPDDTMIGALSLQTQISPNTDHKISLHQARRGGFEADVETYRGGRYELNWKSDDIKATAYTEYDDVEANLSYAPDYSRWDTGLRVDYPLTMFLTLNGSSSYIIRKNRDTSDGVSLDPELANDYDSWNSRIGAVVAVTEKIEFHTYYQHVERISDSEDLDYTRDIVSAVFTYKHAL
jgi:hypothetical protein